MEELKLVIFDMDGLLYDTERPSYLAMKAAMEKRGFAFPLENYKRIIGLGDQECDKHLQEVYGKEFSLKQILQDYQQAFKSILEKEGIGIKPGVIKLLELLEHKGVKKCIASSSSKETIQNYLMKTGLTHLFDFYISGEEVEAGKPNPDIFIEACIRANETPEASLVLEDSLNGLRAAVGASIKCIIVPDLIEPNQEMKKHAYDIAADLYQVIEIIKKSLDHDQ